MAPCNTGAYNPDLYDPNELLDPSDFFKQNSTSNDDVLALMGVKSNPSKKAGPLKTGHQQPSKGSLVPQAQQAAAAVRPAETKQMCSADQANPKGDASLTSKVGLQSDAPPCVLQSSGVQAAGNTLRGAPPHMPPECAAKIAALKGQNRHATPEELEDLLQVRRAAWEDSRPPRPEPVCASCGARAEKLGQPLRCATCRTVLYCSRECQKQHWRTHKVKCKPRRTANICVLSDFA